VGETVLEVARLDECICCSSYVKLATDMLEGKLLARGNCGIVVGFGHPCGVVGEVGNVRTSQVVNHKNHTIRVASVLARSLNVEGEE